jgi:hypothetical protein
MTGDYLTIVLGPGKTLHSSGGRRSIPSMLECAWSYGNSKLGYRCHQQHSNNHGSMMYGSDVGYMHELQEKSGREFLGFISANCLLCSYQLIDFYVLDKSMSPNENNDFYLNPVLCLAGAADCGVIIIIQLITYSFFNPSNLLQSTSTNIAI